MRLNSRVTPAPPYWAEACWHTENKLHQLAPYIGKLKSTIAGDLIDRYTSAGDVVLDTFCGSGTIPLECAIRGRKVLASDANPYAVTLTRAKLEAPRTVESGIERLSERLEASRRRQSCPEKLIPMWVRKFFHPKTLQNAIRFADECIEQDDVFLLACLLGILHHQRPGFLSFPSSHLVPYLRDRKFPKEDFPELYEERALAPRLLSKVKRALKAPVHIEEGTVLSVKHAPVNELVSGSAVDAVITSPPYMNALDYVRDNRLRMWFLDRTTSNYSPEPTDKRSQFDSLTRAFIRNVLPRVRSGGTCVLVVGETVRRKRMRSHPAEIMLDAIVELHPSVRLVETIEDKIPDVRRTRRKSSATKKELMMVLRVH